MNESDRNKCWQQVENAITGLEKAEIPVNIRENKNLSKVVKKYPIRITPYYFDLINRSNFSNDPVAKQCLPDARELFNKECHSDDPLGEELYMPYPYLIHKYADRAVLLVTNRCAVHCRFCFRKRGWQKNTKKYDISDSQLNSACDYLGNHPEIKEILISGGDPLMLENERLEQILRKLNSMANIEVLRLGTRIPVVLPMRVNKNLITILTQFSGLWVATHFNHPGEITEQSIKACRHFIKSGIPVINQTVLLAGINDQVEILETLFRNLVKIGVKPQYLYHVDPAEGTSHFATGIDCGIRILREFRKSLSSLATPIFAIDLPEGGGKVHLQAEYRKNDYFEAIDGRKIKYYGTEL